MSDPFTRDEAFAALGDVVAGLAAASRPAVSAAVKPALAVRSDYRFDEHALGFASFRAFLLAAAEARAVRLSPAPGTTPDVLVHPYVVETDEAPAGPARVDPVRADLWAAFVDWSPAWVRLWDRDAASAVRFPTHASPSEDPAHTAHRDAYNRSPERYAPIGPVSPDTTVAWMAEFADGLADGPTRDLLLRSLAGPRPLRTWTEHVRAHGLLGAWTDRRLRHLRGVILGWAAHNRVDLADVAVGGPSGPPRAVATGAPDRRPEDDGNPTRRWLLNLVASMPAADLGDVAVPVRHVAPV